MLQTRLIEFHQHRRISHDTLGRGDRGLKLGVRQMMDGGAFYDGIPTRLHGGVEADAHEAVVVADGPGVAGRHGREGDAGEALPAGEQGLA